MTTQPNEPRPRRLPFSVVTKPSGAACNLDCTYCFFLDKARLYPESNLRMSPEVAETYVRTHLADHPDGEVVLVWQGGEPTLMGLDFFRHVVALGEKYRRPGQQVKHSIQTNGVLVNDEWAQFFAANNFLVGLTIDGPADAHDAYRVNRAGRGTHAQVIAGWEALMRAGADVNILCTVHAANEGRGAEVYRYFRDELRAEFIQFIPIVERDAVGGVTERSISPAGYGQFLIDVFEVWQRGDIGKVFVQLFDVSLAALFGQYTLCVHAPECGTALALEHNGDVYSCDHYVEPEWLLGNVNQMSLSTALALPKQREFGRAKRTSLTMACQRCPVRGLCHGGCPKDRFVPSPDGEPGHNYLCEGLFAFFTHARPALISMAQLVQAGRPAAEFNH